MPLYVSTCPSSAGLPSLAVEQAADLVYWLQLGERHAPNFSLPLESYVWTLLPARRRVYEQLYGYAQKGDYGPDSRFWATFLAQEVCGLRRSEALASSLMMALQGPAACRASAEAISGALASPGEMQPPKLPRRMRAAWARWLGPRPPSTCAQLWAHTQRAVWRWAEESTPQWGELHLPVVFNAPTAMEAAKLRKGIGTAAMSHVGYLGIGTHLQQHTLMLHLRVDDSWHLPSLTAAARTGEESSSRARLHAATMVVPRSALGCAAIAAKLRPLLSCVQDSTEAFREDFFGLANDPELLRLGGGSQDRQNPSRPLAAQEGPCCIIKNHSRGVASRLENFVRAGRAKAAEPARGPAASRQDWRWLKAQERAAARDLVAHQLGEET